MFICPTETVLLFNVALCVCNRRVLFVHLCTEQLDTANKQRVAKEAECTDQRQHVFVKLLEQSKSMSFVRETVLSELG